MKLRVYLGQLALASIIVLAMGSAASASDRKTTNTILGAGLGAVAGAVITDGDPLITLGSAAAGGLLGNVLTDDRSDRRSRNWDRGRGHHRVERREVRQRYRPERRDHRYRNHR
jgi:hypothetical protein